MKNDLYELIKNTYDLGIIPEYYSNSIDDTRKNLEQKHLNNFEFKLSDLHF